MPQRPEPRHRRADTAPNPFNSHGRTAHTEREIIRGMGGDDPAREPKPRKVSERTMNRQSL